MKWTYRIHVLAIFLLLFSSNVLGQKNRGETPDTLIQERQMEMPTFPEESEIYTVVEDMPAFPGGEDSMRKFISANLVYPDSAIKNKIEGRVAIQFVVDETGKLSDFKVLKKLGHGCDEEALRVIKSMPDWKPGKQRGKPVKVKYVIPIRFQLH